MHVFADLRPYICTFANCKMELAQFTTRLAWADHEFTEHRAVRSWSCPECPIECDSESEWAQHLLECHGRTFSGPKYQIAKEMAYSTQAKPAENEQCPLCQVILGKSRREFVKHVGRHMEEIALMALPPYDGEESELDSASSASASNALPSQTSITQVRVGIDNGPYSLLKSKTPTPKNGALADYHMELTLLEQQNKRRLLIMAGQHLEAYPNSQGVTNEQTPKLPPTSGPAHATLPESSSSAVKKDVKEGEKVPPIPENGKVQASRQSLSSLSPDGDEYMPSTYDENGERKISATGHLLDGRKYRIRTFHLPNRGDKLFMLAVECARVLRYRDSYLLFNKYPSLYGIIATQLEKDNLISQQVLSQAYRSRLVVFVTARSMFRQFGSRVVENGRLVRDDYWEARALRCRFTEHDVAGGRLPGVLPQES